MPQNVQLHGNTDDKNWQLVLLLHSNRYRFPQPKMGVVVQFTNQPTILETCLGCALEGFGFWPPAECIMYIMCHLPFTTYNFHMRTWMRMKMGLVVTRTALKLFKCGQVKTYCCHRAGNHHPWLPGKLIELRKNHIFWWENSLFLWPMLDCQRVYNRLLKGTIWVLGVWHAKWFRVVTSKPSPGSVCQRTPWGYPDAMIHELRIKSKRQGVRSPFPIYQ